MREECPVCETAIDRASTHCPGCGFPTALFGPVGPASALPEPTVPPATAATTSAAPVEAASPALGAAEQTARELGRTAELLVRLGGDTSPLASSLCEAMTIESSGEIDHALSVLRSAERAANETVGTVFRARVARVKERRAKLAEAGVELPTDDELVDLEGSAITEDPTHATETLHDLEGRLTATEGQWHGLEKVFDEIVALRDLAGQAGLSVADVPSRVEEAKALISTRPVGPEKVARAAREATEELEGLGRALAVPAETELDRLSEGLKSSPDDLAARNRARAIRGRAARDLAAGHLTDVLRAVLELRALLGPRGVTPVVAPPTPAPASPEERPATSVPHEPSTAETDVSVDSLLAKARSFAVKVRALPPESEAGRQAAAQIKEAAELLRQGRLVEADQALTRLMRTLASPGDNGR